MVSAHAIATLVVFVISNLFIIHPLSIPTFRPFPQIPINFATAPVLAVALLWAAQCLDLTVIRVGIAGFEGVKPYNVLILYFSLAYMTIALDTLGALAATMSWVRNEGGHNGWMLYLYFYFTFILLSIPLGNDLVILLTTEILVSHTRNLQLHPRAWVMAEFAAANTASMVLFVGNPANVVICKGLSINPAAFTAYTILPFLACCFFCFVVLAFQYRNQVRGRLISATHQDARPNLLGVISVIHTCFHLVLAIIACFLVEGFKLFDAWELSLISSVQKSIIDLYMDCSTPVAERRCVVETFLSHSSSADREHRCVENASSSYSSFTEGVHQRVEDNPSSYSSSTGDEHPQSSQQDGATTINSHPESQIISDGTAPGLLRLLALQMKVRTRNIHWWWTSKMNPLYVDLGHRFPTFVAALRRLPFSFIPFALSQFILIEALDHQGWVKIFATWLVSASHSQLHASIWLVGIIGIVLCSCSGTNFGATILLVRVVRTAALPYDASRGTAIALAVAMNIGAIGFTFSASHAGLLWRSILVQKEVYMKQREFALWNLFPLVAMTTAGLGVVSAEMAVLFRS